MIRRRTALAALLAVPAVARAQGTYPNRPIRVIVPFAAGGGTDVSARIWAQRMSEIAGHQLIIDNRGGSGGNIGAEAFIRTPPDGYTILLTSNGPLTVNRYLYRDMNHDPLRDLLPIGQVFRIEQLLVVNPTAMPVANLQEFIAQARARPGAINYGSAGAGSSLHLAAELFKLRARVNLTHVPYRGGGPAMQDLVAGNIHCMFDSMPSSWPQVRQNTIRPLAMCGSKRHPLLPNLPTMTEAGVPDCVAGTWIAIFAPLGTPAPIVARFAEMSRQALAEPALREALARAGADAEWAPAEELHATMVRETAMWGEVVREAGISAS
ncbi:Bug family tripartite tricarboxylate transporter substrate binding protein [Falsiroseomonas oryzae]|uniref:Bug family tripartite tricarboxylate transporter substrate binding protein n=1 Tax=Falsiroseomonas oryzae TaxID=2766473 RepID=UPI0022EB6937|nr:tripartite tricarboxylate transporter substrate binding protein [Roseomonas sp. MO-31]